ncbi:MAG: hypothetical protein JWN46_452 [Acidimicrobiales bacterium]|nr:hypothetical protein [Acidimicrobiales bacterium]
MPGVEEVPRAVVVLVVDGREVPLGAVGRATRCDLALVDRLLRMRLAAARLGWFLALREVDAVLQELLDLVGVSACLGV